MFRTYSVALIVALFGASTAAVFAQPSTPEGLSAPAPSDTMPTPPPPPEDRAQARAAHQATLTEVTAAIELANRLDRARRVAPIDLFFGLP
jgi:hypothetical protein